ncbi:hypothetical protein QLX52_30545 [Streptomyces albus]|uniref:hypothetical protein n=1 Tax=Streptomyces albus TaxID=1888 RepID=UPI0024ADBDBB|nr:hypothetical protein [Streptomyces albus]MDI6413149.1 hypothetical protein [Streptomyces albus]
MGNPLQLTKTMRTRLLAAVRALVSDPALKGAGDPARLAAVVLMAKAKVADDFSTRITAKELGRWVGLKPSRIAHHVLPQLRDRGVLGSRERVSEAGRMTGLECWVIPMYRAQYGGDRRHVLALSRMELVVLLALIEALFAPGWEHKDGRTTPAGMLADRTGRGAATDRLGLLLMVLSSNSKGWLQLCSGSVDTERGRPAATVARLLGCSPAAGAKVLSRLQEQHVLLVGRRETASGLNARSRVRLLPVAKAHGIAVQETREAADAVFSDLAATASGDHEATVGVVPPVITGVQGTGEELEADSADRADTAHRHASHAPVVTPVGQVELSDGFSGGTPSGSPGRPERAGAREDAPRRPMADGQAPVPSRPGRKTAGGEPGSALRAEKPTAAPSHSTSPAALGVWGRVARRLPLTCEVLQPLLPQPSRHQRRLLDRMLDGLLAEGDDDAMIAARLRQRLAPLATGDSQRPYRFRRDALAWALSIGLPLSPGGRTLVPCAVSGCPGRTWGRVTDLRIRCDECELAALARAEAAQARIALEAALQTPLPAPAPAPVAAGQPAPGETPVPNTPRGPGRVPAACTGAPRDAATGTVPPTVHEQIALLEQLDPAAGRTARRAAAIMYASESETEPGPARDQQRAWAASAWATLTDRYTAQLTAHYSTPGTTEEAA